MSSAVRMSLAVKTCGKDIKGVWRMPWHEEAMKGVANCDKPRGAKARFDTGIPEWGNPIR